MEKPSHIKQVELFTKFRPHIPAQCRDELCPDPGAAIINEQKAQKAERRRQLLERKKQEASKKRKAPPPGSTAVPPVANTPSNTTMERAQI